MAAFYQCRSDAGPRKASFGTLINPPASYAQMAETRYQDWPQSAMLPHVLERRGDSSG